MSSALRISVISDTHNRLPESLVHRVADADEIWHLGDVCRPETLDKLEAIGSPLHVAQGNCDPYFHWESQVMLERNGQRFLLQHLPPRDVPTDLAAALFGHLHYPVRDRIADVPVLNPGAITGPRNQSQSSFAWLRIEADGNWTWDVEAL